MSDETEDQLVAEIEKLVRESENRVLTRLEQAVDFVLANNSSSGRSAERALVMAVLKKVFVVARETS